jgi:hypothetical protein
MELYARQEELHLKKKEMNKQWDARRLEATPEEEEYWFDEEESSRNEHWKNRRFISHMQESMHRMTAFAKFEEALAPSLCSDLAKKIWDDVEFSFLKQEEKEQEKLDNEYMDAYLYGAGMGRAEPTEEGMEIHLRWLGERRAWPYWEVWYMHMAYGFFDHMW